MQDPNEPTLSVILPAYNAGHLLVSAVKSVLEQTFDDFELLLLDDGSTDGSVEALRVFSDNRLKIITDGTNCGLAYRLNEGIRLSRGKYIARMDADDLCFPDRFEKQVNFLETNPGIDLLATRAVVFTSQGHLIGLLPFRQTHADICSRPWLSLPMPHPTWMARKEWYLRFSYQLPEYVRAEDQELLLRAMPSSRFGCLNDVLLAYRQGPFSLRKTLRARRSLLGAQLHHFYSRGEYRALIFSLLAFCAKCMIDVIAALPGFDQLFFNRMGHKLSREDEERALSLLSEYKEYPAPIGRSSH